MKISPETPLKPYQPIKKTDYSSALERHLNENLDSLFGEIRPDFGNQPLFIIPFGSFFTGLPDIGSDTDLFVFTENDSLQEAKAIPLKGQIYHLFPQILEYTVMVITISGASDGLDKSPKGRMILLALASLFLSDSYVQNDKDREFLESYRQQVLKALQYDEIEGGKIWDLACVEYKKAIEYNYPHEQRQARRNVASNLRGWQPDTEFQIPTFEELQEIYKSL